MFRVTFKGIIRIFLLSREQIPDYIDVTAVIQGIRRISTSSSVVRDIGVRITDNFGLLEDEKEIAHLLFVNATPEETNAKDSLVCTHYI